MKKQSIGDYKVDYKDELDDSLNPAEPFYRQKFLWMLCALLDRWSRRNHSGDVAQG